MRNVDYLIDSCKLLTKPEIAQIVGVSASRKKDDLLKILEGKLQANPKDIVVIYQEYRDNLAAAPYEVESILCCTSEERKRWTLKGYLPVLPVTKRVKVPGRWIDCPTFDRYELAQITESDIKRWREKDDGVKRANRLAGLLKAKETRQKNEKIRNAFKEEWGKNVCAWDKIDSELSAVFQLAYWTMWISRWAKVYTLKQKNCRSITITSLFRAEKYKSESEDLYSDKEEAVKLLMDSPFAATSVYIPIKPHKVVLEICSDHFEEYELYELSREERIEFYLQSEELQNCPNCRYELTEHYYALVHVSVSDPRVDCKFSFHLPYLNVGYLLPCDIDSMPRVQQVEQEGMFRFGRPVYNDEKVIYTEKFVKKSFEKALSSLRSLWHKQLPS